MLSFVPDFVRIPVSKCQAANERNLSTIVMPFVRLMHSLERKSFVRPGKRRVESRPPAIENNKVAGRLS